MHDLATLSDPSALVEEALLVWAIATILLCRRVGLLAAIVAGGIRAAVPYIYFRFFFDYRWTFSDDMDYIAQATSLLDKGFGAFTCIFDPVAHSALLSLKGGSHYLYTWWNVLWMQAFGVRYYAPTFINVLLTCAAAGRLGRILEDLGFSKVYARRATLFFLLHLEVIVWSSFPNLKDAMMLSFTTFAFSDLIRVIAPLPARRRAFHGACLAVVLLLFMRVRFYVPLLILGTAAVWYVIHNLRLKVAMGLGIGAVVMAYAFPWQMINLEIVKPDQLLYGLLRFPLTPRPWGIDSEYSFLTFPIIVHWLLIIPAFGAAVRIWKQSKPARLLLLYLVALSLTFALVPELQGPRHRVQALFVIAWLQYDACWLFYRKFVPARVAAITGCVTTLPTTASN